MEEYATEKETETEKLTDAAKEDIDINYLDIASKLLNDRLLLTALELHCELSEAGKEIPKLKEFFSNPGNFEQQSARPELSPTILSTYHHTSLLFLFLELNIMIGKIQHDGQVKLLSIRWI